MVQGAEEHVEAVYGRREFVAVAEVVLAELAGGIAHGFQQFGDRRIFRLQAELCSGKANLGQPGANW